MNNVRFFLLVISGVIIFTSCDESNEKEELTRKTGVLIVNEGNFGSGNGSVSFYDEELLTIENNVIKNANNGAEIGALIQSVYMHDGVGYLLCNDANKIEFFSLEDYKFLDNPATNISVPRYMTIVGDKGYITCWGPYDASWALPDSYIAVLDLASRAVIDTLECGSGPEGILAVGTRLFVANSFETSVSVIDLSDHSSAKIDFEAAPQHFVSDANGNIWVSISSGWSYPADKSGLHAFNNTTLEKGVFIPVLDIEGGLAADADGETIYILTTEAYPGTGSLVFEFNTVSKSLAGSPLITGENFYGIGYNSTTEMLYVADNQAFAGSGRVLVYNASGILIDDQETGVGPNGFLFK